MAESRAKKLREKRLIAIRQSIAEIGAIPSEVFPGMVAAAGDCNCNPCAEQQPGILTCDGSGLVVEPFPTDGTWNVQIVNGQLRFANPAPALPAEALPPPSPAAEPAPEGD